MNEAKISHDIQNAIERLRIMHDLVLGGDFSDISKDEIKSDLKKTLKEIEDHFEELF